MPCSDGRGSSTVPLSRVYRFYTASFNSSLASTFPSTSATGPGAATVVTSNGALQAADASFPSPPNPTPAASVVSAAPPPPTTAFDRGKEQSSQSSTTTGIILAVVGLVVIVVTASAILYYVHRYCKNRARAPPQAGPAVMDPAATALPRPPERFTERYGARSFSYYPRPSFEAEAGELED
ncbi:hypothetical protein WJX73_000382 [Symbiochloris irregularis]|uniref:Uncharacterized protein n=1 Tax=Symbiochloris irregularis TaxID=706552 RepID=A0AAW1NPZ4_9CHLO